MSKKEESNKILKTRYFDYLLKNMEEIDKERIEFNKDFKKLINKKTDEMAIILKCHLIIEHNIDKYIKVAFPAIEKLEDMNLTFYKKILMICNENTFTSIYKKSMFQINTLRNKFVHNLNYGLKESDFNEIQSIMNAWYEAGGYKTKKNLETIIDYTMWLTSNINITIHGIEKESKKLGLSGYLCWLENMNEKK